MGSLDTAATVPNDTYELSGQETARGSERTER